MDNEKLEKLVNIVDNLRNEIKFRKERNKKSDDDTIVAWMAEAGISLSFYETELICEALDQILTGYRERRINALLGRMNGKLSYTLDSKEIDLIFKALKDENNG